MPSINRTTILAGPALITFGGESFWSKGDVTVKPSNQSFDIQAAHFGKVDERFSDKSLEVSFEPAGAFAADVAAVLWPYAATPVGASLYGASDTPLVVHSRSGTKLTLHNAQITRLPSLRLGVAQTMMGQVAFTAILKNSTDPTASGAYFTIASEAYPGDAGFDVGDIKTLAYASAWGGSAPWSSFLTEAGWQVDFELQTSRQLVDGLGTVDITLQGLAVSATAIPVGPAEADVMSKLGYGAALGTSLGAGSADLVVSAAGVHFTLYQAAINDSELGYGATRKRLGQTRWIATRSVTGGTADPLYRLATAAPE